MFNVTIVRLKDVLKYALTIIILISVIMFIKEVVEKDLENNKYIEIGKEIENFFSDFIFNSINQELSSIEVVSGEGIEVEEETKRYDILNEILKSELSAIKPLEESKISNYENTNIETNETIKENEEEQVQKAETGLPTEVITQNPVAESYTYELNSVKIKNETDYYITEETLLNKLEFNNENILIFQTHTCESYTPTELNTYESSGNYRTIDLDYSVARVGTELSTSLRDYEFNVYHDLTFHDYPSYSGSYTNSLRTVETILQTNPADIVIDIHRDAIGSITDYAPTVRIGEEEVAQLMFVIGTNAGGLYHPNWEYNLQFAYKVQEKANELYPGLFKPIFLTESRYNQHTSKYASIIEVGATGNTLEQANASMKYLAKVIDEVIKENK